MTDVHCIGRGLVTPVGDTPAQVLQAVREGRSALRLHPGFPEEPYYASLLEREGFSGPSFFIHIAVEAARKAIADAGIDAGAPGTALILSTAKGEIDQLGKADVCPAASARIIARELGIPTPPLVVSNACISGLAALLQGMRMLRSGAAKQLVVVGAEVQSPFIVTGFQSLKALSQQPCRPFDAAREGLNLGEAAAAMVLSSEASSWTLVDGAIRNDANHISGPSRTGEGSYQALMQVLPQVALEELAFVNVHGTATVYNDEMEAIALSRAGLSEVPVNALKGIFGHTMGAAGVLESIVSMEALDAGIVLPTRGYAQSGVSCPVSVSARERAAKGNAFIKLLSGFGGVNGALLLRKGGAR